MKSLLLPAHTASRKAPVNVTSVDNKLFQNEYNILIKDCYLYLFKSAIIAQQSIWDTLSFSFKFSLTQHRPIAKKKLLSLVAQLLKQRPQKIRKAVWIIDTISNGYFHWLTDALPRLQMVEDKLQDAVLMLPQYYKQFDFVTASLTAFTDNIFYYDTEKVYKVETLYVPGYLAATGNYNRTIINQLRTKFIDINVAQPSRKIYISRKKANKRFVVNEDECIVLFQKYGIECLCFEEYDFKSQVAILQHTQLLISLHGAALTNMLFMPPNGAIIEIRNGEDSNNNCYFSLASDLEHSYYYIKAEGDTTNTFMVNVLVNISALEALLTTVTERKN